MSLDSPGSEKVAWGLEELRFPGGREGLELTLKDAAAAAVSMGMAD